MPRGTSHSQDSSTTAKYICSTKSDGGSVIATAEAVPDQDAEQGQHRAADGSEEQRVAKRDERRYSTWLKIVEGGDRR